MVRELDECTRGWQMRSLGTLPGPGWIWAPDLGGSALGGGAWKSDQSSLHHAHTAVERRDMEGWNEFGEGWKEGGRGGGRKKKDNNKKKRKKRNTTKTWCQPIKSLTAKITVEFHWSKWKQWHLSFIIGDYTDNKSQVCTCQSSDQWEGMVMFQWWAIKSVL